MRIPVRYKVLKSTLPLTVTYKCERCGKENRFIHYVEATTPAAKKYAENENREIIEKQLKKLADSKNPEIYPEVLITHECGHCGNIPTWGSFKKNNTESLSTSGGIGMMLSFALMLIVGTTGLINMGEWTLLLALSPMAILPAVKYFITKRKNRKTLEQLKALDAQYLPIFTLAK